MWRDIIWTPQNWLRIRFLSRLGVKHICSCVRISKPWHHWANTNLTGIYECTNHSPAEGMFRGIQRKRSECKYSGLGDCFWGCTAETEIPSCLVCRYGDRQDLVCMQVRWSSPRWFDTPASATKLVEFDAEQVWIQRDLERPGICEIIVCQKSITTAYNLVISEWDRVKLVHVD